MKKSLPSDGPDPEDSLKALADHFGMEFLHRLPVPGTASVAALPFNVAQQYHVAPVEFDDTGILLLAISDPNNFYARDSVSALLRCEIEFVVASASEIQRVIKRAYPGNS